MLRPRQVVGGGYNARSRTYARGKTYRPMPQWKAGQAAALAGTRNAGASGLTAEGAIANATYAGHVGELARLAPDLVIIQIEGNDILQAISPATFSASLQTMITAAKNVGADVILLVDIPLNGFQGTRAPYDAVVKSLGASNKINVVDLNTRWGNDYSVGYGKGRYFDDYHANEFGLGDIAQALYDVMR